MKSLAFLAAGIIGGTMAIFWYWITGPERSVQNQPSTPDGLRVVVVDFPSDPNLVTYDPERVTHDDLAIFARNLCGKGPKDISEQAPTLLDNLRGHHRATITCY